MLYVEEGGNVGIGTAAPDANTKLDVVGAIRASGGIQPNGNAYSASEILDDYEEGTWTPVLSDGTNNATSSTAVGIYTKIGRTVHFTMDITLSNLGSVSGAARITGLPFTTSSVANSFASFSVGYCSGLSITAGTSTTANCDTGQTYFYMRLWEATTGTNNLESGDLTNTSRLMITGTYTT